MSPWVRIPGSTSNLGPGFDVLGLAVDRFLEARYSPGPAPLSLLRSGTLGALTVPPARDNIVQALLETIASKSLSEGNLRDLSDLSDPGGTLRVRSTIPVGRGLGSSAAAWGAGRILGLLATDQPVHRDEVVRWITVREGHPDNAAPALLGGLRASTVGADGAVRSVSLALHPELAWVYAAPNRPLDTAASRKVLPDRVTFGAAVRTARRMALLLPALARGDGSLLARAMDDELHVPYRLPLIPGGRSAVEAGRRAGAWAVTLSGAGSGLLAVTPPERAEAVGRAMEEAFRSAPGSGGGFHHRLRPWEPGAVWGRGEPPLATDPGGSAGTRE